MTIGFSERRAQCGFSITGLSMRGATVFGVGFCGRQSFCHLSDFTRQRDTFKIAMRFLIKGCEIGGIAFMLFGEALHALALGAQTRGYRFTTRLQFRNETLQR